MTQRWLVLILLISACSKSDHLGRAPTLSAPADSEYAAMMSSGAADVAFSALPNASPSLWSGGRQSLLGDRRAMRAGDILTVVIEIDDKAEISNSTARGRSSSEQLAIPEFFGIPQTTKLGGEATLAQSVQLDSKSSAKGDGSVRRNEKLTLRVAATITEVLPNGIFAIAGNQEVRVNFELRELLVSGFVRPADVSRQNEIAYDKIASARISYGGRGHISDVQQPRIGTQIVDMILPF